MNCRPHCGACCIAPSINHPLPGMPTGKPAGVPCANLDLDNFSCKIWGQPEYPDTCRRFHASAEVCGNSRVEALRLIGDMEQQTS